MPKKDDTYSIKEMIVEFRVDVKENFTRVSERLDKIEAQTTKTNGRVNSLENHKSWLWGAYASIVVLGGAIITLAIMAIDTKIQNGFRSDEVKKEIKASVVEALQEQVAKVQYEK